MRKYCWVMNVKSKKIIYLIVILVLVFFLLVMPYILNLIMNLDLGININQDNIWIGFHSSYLGGIFGGIISGALTLGGVYLTIKNQEKTKMKDEFPKMSLNLDHIFELMPNLLYLESLLYNKEYEKFFKIMENFESKRRDILTLAAGVNANFYEIIRSYLGIVEKTGFIHDNIEYEIDELLQEIPNYNVFEKYRGMIYSNLENMKHYEKMFEREYEKLLEKHKVL